MVKMSAVQEEDRYRISTAEKAKYTQMFLELDPDKGFLSSRRAVPSLLKSGLSRQMLGKVLALADQDHDGALSLQEFCSAMNLISCVRNRGLSLPDALIIGTYDEVPNISGRRESEIDGRDNSRETTVVAPSSSPKRHSRVASLVGSAEFKVPIPASDTSVPGVHKPSASRRYDQPKGDHGQQQPDTGVQSRAPKSAIRRVQDSQAEHSSTVSRDHRTRPPRNRRPNLRQLNADDVDAVYAGSQGMVDSLRDVQSWRLLVAGIERLEMSDIKRGAPTRRRPRRRHTLPQEAQGEVARNEQFLPGRGRRTSLLVASYEPAAHFLRRRAEQESIREVEQEKATATAITKWTIQPLPEDDQRPSDTAVIDDTNRARGNLNVAGLPLLDEDVATICHLLRRNMGFKKLDLSTCFLSDEHFLSLAQAVAWNCRVEELCLQGCVVTSVVIGALTDVLTVNKHIQSVDLRGCQGLEEEGLRRILAAADKGSKLSTVNGMKLASLRAENSDTLDLSGFVQAFLPPRKYAMARGKFAATLNLFEGSIAYFHHGRQKLGYMEAVIAGHCLRRRADGLQRVDLRGNLITTKAFTALMEALRTQSHLLSLDLSHNQIDERSLPDVEELLRRNTKLARVELTDNRISCTEFERFGLDLMRSLSSNNTVTVFNVGYNDVSPRMLAAIAEKLAANRAVRRDMTFVDCLHLKYPRTAPKPVLADPRKLHLHYVDVHFMAQEGISELRTTILTGYEDIQTLSGVKRGAPQDFFSVEKCDANKAPEGPCQPAA